MAVVAVVAVLALEHKEGKAKAKASRAARREEEGANTCYGGEPDKARTSSAPAEAKCSPVASNRQDATGPLCPCKVYSKWPSRRSHT
jgi:hypothetical protein